MQKQFKVEIENMRLVELVDTPEKWAENIIEGNPYRHLHRNRKEYPILASDLSYWQPLDGKIVGEDSFKVGKVFIWNAGNYTNKCKVCGKMFMHGVKIQPVCKPCCNTTYAIPIQPKEQGEVNFNSPEIQSKLAEVKEEIRIVMDNAKPASPASDEEGWEEVELREVIGNAIMKFSNPTATDEIIHYLKSNYHPPKRKQ